MKRCQLCFHRCALEEGQRGICRARVCRGGRIVEENYGRITSLALDPIEKKPLRHFYPGSFILSVGSYGCNLRCPFCQNDSIAMSDGSGLAARRAEPVRLAELAGELRARGNIGLAYTYNEPTVSYDFVVDCARLIHERQMKNVLVTNGSLLSEPLRGLLPLIDAMNVDLKGFTEAYYRWLGGDLETVKNFIRRAVEFGCHVEVTTLVVHGKNDGDDEVERLAAWLASLDRDLPLHLSRFFPRYKVQDRPPTPVARIYRLAELARRHLTYVYEGNC